MSDNEKEFLEIYEALVMRTPAPKSLLFIGDIDSVEEEEYCECCGAEL